MKNSCRLRPILVCILSLTMPHLISSARAAETSASDRQAVLDVIQKFFDTMAAKDTEGAKATLLADGQYYAVRDDANGQIVRRRTHEEYLAGLATGKGRSLERMWDATVMVHGRIAMVWTPYDFHRDGKFTHSGIDAFTLVKTDGGWKIAGVVYTVEPNVPSRHPAGPPPVGPGN